jgi:glycosyltransferase involved in cell wall biosynthesis
MGEGATNGRLRVLHVTATTTGGVGLLILFLIKHLDRRAFDMEVAFGRGYLLDRSFDETNVRMHTLSTSRRVGVLSILKGTFEVYRILKQGRFDVVQTHTSVGGVIGRLAGWLSRTPVVMWTVHGLGAHAGLATWKRAMVRRVEICLDWFTDHYVAVSHDLREEGVRTGIFREQKVTVIPNGLEFNHLPSHFDPAAKRRSLGIAQGIPLIGTVTRLEPQKANDVFLRAVAIAARRVPGLVVLIAGDGPQRNSLEALAAELGLGATVRFLGWRSDAVELLGTLDIFCMTSRWEGCPMVLLEAMAMERPVVATNIGGVREIVVDGDTGVLVEQDNPDHFADALVRLLEAEPERTRMGRSGRRHVEQHFNSRRMLEAYAGLYRSLVDRGRPGREQRSQVMPERPL